MTAPDRQWRVDYDVPYDGRVLHRSRLFDSEVAREMYIKRLLVIPGMVEPQNIERSCYMKIEEK